MNDRPELRHLHYFVAVAEELHFGRAAQRLHIAQPPLSQQIRRLEEMVGHTLLQRTSREVRLTAAGRELLERARHTLRKVENDVAAVQRIGRGEVGSLTVGFTGSAMLTTLPGMLGRYRRKYPEVDLVLREAHTSVLLNRLQDGTIDAGFLRDAGQTEGLIAEPFFAESFIAVLPAKHPLAAKRAVPIRSLQREPFVLFSPLAGGQAWQSTIAVCEAGGFQPRVVQEAPQWLTIMRLVGAGIGVTIAPACVSKLGGPDTACRRLIPGFHRTQIDLVYREGEDRPLLSAFCAMARSAFRAGK